jgi:hypothetical protein
MRKRTTTKNQYGVWEPICHTCSKKKTSDQAKKRAKGFYLESNGHKEELLILAKLNSYPVVVPGNLGTNDFTTNLKIVEIDGKMRIKGAVLLERWRKTHGNS